MSFSVDEKKGLLVEEEDNSLEFEKARTPSNGLISLALGLIITAINLYVFTLARQPPYTGVRTYEELIQLRRPNQFIGLEKTTLAPDADFPPRRVHANLLSVVNKSEPNHAYGDEYQHFMDYSNQFSKFGNKEPPIDRRFIVSSEASTIAEYIVTDYRMDDCQLELSLPSGPAPENRSLELGPSKNIIDLWLLDSSHPLYGKTLTWNQRPARVKKIESINMEYGEKYVHKFVCPMNSRWAFEFAPGTPDTHVEWIQTWSSPSPRVTMYQYRNDDTTFVPYSYQPTGNEGNQKLSWTMPELDQVMMRVLHLSSNYALNVSGWEHMLPSGGHTVHIEEEDGSGIGTYTVALFHQLKCLEILRDTYLDEGSHRTTRREISSHCMNYFRESVKCSADMHNMPQGTRHTYTGYDFLCYDWQRIFDEAEKNQLTYVGGH